MQYFNTGQQAVYAFKDEQLATLESVAVPIYQTSDNNIASFEVLVSTEGPDKGFVSVGIVNPKNVKTYKSVFQKFKFPEPARARYVKLVLGKNASNGNSYIRLYEFQVFGTLGEGTPKQPEVVSVQDPAPAKSEAINILDSKNGGQIISASHDLFVRLNDGKTDTVQYFNTGQQAVYAFKDEQIATLESVAVPIYQTSDNNIASFEVLISTEGLDKGFTKAGTFSPKNIKSFKSVFQVFKFSEPVKAQYIKFVLGKNASNGNSYIRLYEFQVFGTLD
ncbi:MAG: hypothetical protein GY699_14115 [Desulfobacteraceae bacterium]|nr:hypothetical protein [Desulfobacteraceae bacterium]